MGGAQEAVFLKLLRELQYSGLEPPIYKEINSIGLVDTS